VVSATTKNNLPGTYVRLWHKADVQTALMNVRLGHEQTSRHVHLTRPPNWAGLIKAGLAAKAKLDKTMASLSPGAQEVVEGLYGIDESRGARRYRKGDAHPLARL
jgi:hypothetical protein